MRRLFITSLLLTALVGCTQAQTLQLRLLETSDLHMNLLDWDYYQDKPSAEVGLVRAATLIRAARAEASNSLLFDNGDLLQGTPLGDRAARHPSAVHPAIRLLNALHYDAANLGNHDFNYGLPALRRAMKGAKFPYLNANVMTLPDGKPAFTPTALLTRKFMDTAGQPHTLKIGLVGLVPPQIMEWDRQNLAGRVTVQDMVQTARALVPQLKAQGADLVLVIAHTGLDHDAEPPPGSEYMAVQLAQVPGVDALLLGHQHEEFPGAFFKSYPGVDIEHGQIHGVPATMPGHWGSDLGVIDLTLEHGADGHWQASAGEGSVRPIFDTKLRKPLVEADAKLASLVAPEHQATLADMRRPVARISAPLFSYFSQVMDDPSVQLVSDAQAAYARRLLRGTPLEKLPLLSAAAPFKAGGRQGVSAYTDIPAGTIAAKNVADLYLYPNTVQVVKIKGAELREWLEMAAGQYRRIDPAGPAVQELVDPNARSYNSDTVDGVSYEIDVTQEPRYGIDGKLIHPEAHRIRDLRYQGQPVDEAADFLVVTNNYRANGGGNFPGLGSSRIVLDTPMETRQVLSAYIAAQKTLTPKADGNWHVQPVPGVRLSFTSSAAGAAYLPRVPGICLAQTLEGGWALYELRPPAAPGDPAALQTGCAPVPPAH